MITVTSLTLDGDDVILDLEEPPISHTGSGKAMQVSLPKRLLCDAIKWALSDPATIIVDEGGG